MQDIVVLIIIWGLITFFGKLFKGKKGVPAKPQRKSPAGQPEIPPLLRDILGLPKEQPQPVAPPVKMAPEESTPYTLPESEDFFEEEIPPQEFEDTSAVDKKTAELPAEPYFEERESPGSLPREKSAKTTLAKRSVKGNLNLGNLSRSDLKRAILLKEILGQPRSMRPLQPYQRS